jgi:VWFA-related protein
MRWTPGLLIFTSFILFTSLAAQQPVFRSTTDVVHSQVIVRNPRGEFLPGLTEKDFEVYEDGVRQTILTFVATSGGRVMTELVPSGEPPREGLVMPRSSRANDAPGRIFIIFIDDLHLHHEDTPQIQSVLRLIRDSLLHDNDLVGLVSTGYASVSSEVGPDPQHRRFDEAAAKVMGAAPSYYEIIHGAQTIEGPSGLRFNAGTAFRTAYEILDQAERITDRRKAFIYLSSGYDFNPLADSRYQALQDLYASPAPVGNGAPAAFSNPLERGHLQFSEADLVSALGALVRRAVRANVTFYAVDPRGLIAGPPTGLDVGIDEWTKTVNTSLSSLYVISNNTGGVCVCGTNDFKGGLQRIDNEMSDYYMIGYQSTNVDPMKIRRRIEIKVLRPGAKAIYPDSYTIKR